MIKGLDGGDGWSEEWSEAKKRLSLQILGGEREYLVWQQVLFNVNFAKASEIAF